MTLQTTAPIKCITPASSQRQAFSLAQDVAEGKLDLDPPYQRGQVWDLDQRRSLVFAWLKGTPTGVVILSHRGNDLWAQATEDVYATGAPVWACVDGKQRVSTAIAWVNDDFAVPASWFPDEWVAVTEDTSDGSYLRHSGLTGTGRRKLDNRAGLLVCTYDAAATVSDEAGMYLLVNSGGTPQVVEAMEAARRIAEEGQG